MGLFGSIFNKSKPSKQETSQPVQPEAQTKLVEQPKLIESQEERWFSTLHTENLAYKFKVLKELSDEGYAPAQHDLGSMYMKGEYVEEDWETARELFLACEEEIPYAALWLGMIGVHPEKFRVEREDQLAEAFYYMAEAAGRGIEEAFPLVHEWWHRLDKYEDRNWIARNFREQFTEMLEKLETQADEKSLDTIGLFYLHGIYYEQNLAKAKEYFEKSAAFRPEDTYSLAAKHLKNPLFEILEDGEDDE